MARPGRELGKAKCPELAADRRLVQRDAEFLEDPPSQILAAPADDAVDRRDRAALDDLRQGPTLRVVQLGAVSRRLAIDETTRSAGVEAQNPIAHDLQGDAADPGRIRARAAVIDLRQRQ